METKKREAKREAKGKRKVKQKGKRKKEKKNKQINKKKYDTRKKIKIHNAGSKLIIFKTKKN